MGVGCLWTGGEAAGAGVGEGRRKEPSEMDHEAALLVLAPPKSNQDCHGPRTCSPFSRPRPRAVRLVTCPFIGRADPSFHAA